MKEKKISEYDLVMGMHCIQELIRFYPKKIWKVYVQDSIQKNSQKKTLLDQIHDPHNIGAIFRSAECFGVDGVIFSEKNGPSITPSVSKVSSGASEHLPLIRIANLALYVEKMKEAGFTICAACLADSAMRLTDFSYPEIM